MKQQLLVLVEWAKYIPAFCDLPLDDQVRPGRRTNGSVTSSRGLNVNRNRRLKEDLGTFISQAEDVFLHRSSTVMSLGLMCFSLELKSITWFYKTTEDRIINSEITWPL